jgi:hypothetical protein
MENARRAATAVYFAALLAGGSAATWALWITYEAYGDEPGWQTVRRGGAGLVAMMVTLLFTFVLIKHGFRIVAPVFFLGSYLLASLTLDFTLAGSAKGWSPSTAAEASRANVVGVIAMVATLTLVGMAAWFSGRRTSRLAS